MEKLHGFAGMSVKLGVANGNLPHEALSIVDTNGNALPDFTGNPGSGDVVIDHPQGNELLYDTDRDGKVTESELFSAATEPGDRARNGFLNTWNSTKGD
jgi:hypothetical protein